MVSLAPLRWDGDSFAPADYCDPSEFVLEVADSWLVRGGEAFALALHETRFRDGAAKQGFDRVDVDGFWNAALAEIPRRGDWFPRVELQSRAGAPSLIFRLRAAPELTLSVKLASHLGADPRIAPTVKGPDLSAMSRLRTAAQQHGADEAVLLTEDGFVTDGSTTALLWWRGDTLCSPRADFKRVDSVTAKSLISLAGALGIETLGEAITPMELDGCEVWAVNALHGIRMVTEWMSGPGLAEQPGRLALWRNRREALRRPLEGPSA
ncbi:MAG: aminotransferase class IV [Terrimesophilobacter sp.]